MGVGKTIITILTADAERHSAFTTFRRCALLGAADFTLTDGSHEQSECLRRGTAEAMLPDAKLYLQPALVMCAQARACPCERSAVTADYLPNSCSAVCGMMFACAKTDVPALTSIWLRVNVMVSRAMSASRIMLSENAEFCS